MTFHWFVTVGQLAFGLGGDEVPEDEHVDAEGAGKGRFERCQKSGQRCGNPNPAPGLGYHTIYRQMNNNVDGFAWWHDRS